MGILNTLKSVKNDGFDPKTSKINDGGRLDTGRYPVRLIQAEHDADSKGRIQLVIKLEVVSGEYKERKETIFLCFDEDLPEFVLSKNAKILMAIAEFAKVKFTNKDLEDEEATAEALKKGIGNQFIMDLKIVPNKKNPEYPYRNYEFDSIEGEDPFNSDSNDVDEDDLPF